MNPLRRIPLFKRFPTFRVAPHEDDLVKPGERDKYPAFAGDFKTLDGELMPTFRGFDNEAIRNQNTYRGMYIILILGGAIVTIFGILQIAFLDTAWIGIAGSIVAFGLAAVTSLLSQLKYQKRYLNARLRAERLRSEYFLFLGRFDHYGAQDRVQNLRQRVADIEAGGEA